MPCSSLLDMELLDAGAPLAVPPRAPRRHRAELDVLRMLDASSGEGGFGGVGKQTLAGDNVACTLHETDGLPSGGLPSDLAGMLDGMADDHLPRDVLADVLAEAEHAMGIAEGDLDDAWGLAPDAEADAESPADFEPPPMSAGSGKSEWAAGEGCSLQGFLDNVQVSTYGYVARKLQRWCRKPTLARITAWKTSVSMRCDRNSRRASPAQRRDRTSDEQFLHRLWLARTEPGATTARSRELAREPRAAWRQVLEQRSGPPDPDPSSSNASSSGARPKGNSS